MKSVTLKKDDNVCLLLLIGYLVLIIAYLLAMYLWIKGLWNVPFAELEVKHAVQTGVWAKTSHVIYKWSKRNLFPHSKG